jgi:hypothetical protein
LSPENGLERNRPRRHPLSQGERFGYRARLASEVVLQVSRSGCLEALALALLLVGSSARADAPLHVALVLDRAGDHPRAHEALMVGLAKAGFDPVDEDGVAPDSTLEDLQAASLKHHQDPYVLIIGRTDGKKIALAATAAMGMVTAREDGTATDATLNELLVRLATQAAQRVAPRQSQSSGTLLGSSMGHSGLILGIVGVGLFALGYIPALVVGSSYGDTVPNAARAVKVPLAGPFIARTKLSDEILTKGASPGLLGDGALQIVGVTALAAGAGLLIWQGVEMKQAEPAATPPAVTWQPQFGVGPGVVSAGAVFSW